VTEKSLDAVARAEQAKYRKMWDQPEYRVWSPGEESADEAMEAFGRSSVIDFGCGEGRALDRFLAASMIAVGVDLVPLHDAAIEACLWDLPDSLKPAAWGFCADVMEHLPEDKVDAVLANIASKVRMGCYFRISTLPDGMGCLIGETLHLTVRDGQWWRTKVVGCFESAKVRVAPDHVVIVARKSMGSERAAA